MAMRIGRYRPWQSALRGEECLVMRVVSQDMAQGVEIQVYQPKVLRKIAV